MINLAIGIAIGAAFSPFWMKVWTLAKDKIASFTGTTKGD